MHSAASAQPTASLLVSDGLKELELLLGVVFSHSSEPALIAGDDRNCLDVSSAAAKLLGVSSAKITDHRIDDFIEPKSRSQIAQRWRTFLAQGEQEGALHFAGSNGSAREVQYIAKSNVLPGRHVIFLLAGVDGKQIPSQGQDYALFTLDADGQVVAWYSGAERTYGYKSEEIIGEHASCLYSGDDELRVRLQAILKRTATEGHFGNEGWHEKKDGTRFWANVLTVAIRDQGGELRGFARVVRDFSERQEREEKLRRSRARRRPLPPGSTIAGIIAGESGQIPEANDAFLELVGYSREDLLSGRLHWPDLTPPEYLALDELAHEEGLRFGACHPFEKELICKDGSRVPVLVATAVLKLSPFRWITFVTDLHERDRLENVEEEVVEGEHNFEEIVGSSKALKRVMAQVEVVAPTDATVLILGETGTGKELVARAIHRMSPRRNLPFITLNCAAIPTGLLESELFGYERGAFTGALSQKIGRFEMAHRGTLFLDEVGDIPVDLQPKLLRALQEKSFERLGGTRTIPIDVRLVAATNRNLTQMMEDKLFRSDLYYRLKVFPIVTAPLRDHPEDIPILARHFTKKYAAKMDRQIEKIPAETMRALVNWPWPGNVRELENFIERSVILSRGPNLRAPLGELRANVEEPGGSSTLEEMERNHILRVFRETGGVVSSAATRLGVPRTTLNAMMKKLGISRGDL